MIAYRSGFVKCGGHIFAHSLDSGGIPAVKALMDKTYLSSVSKLKRAGIWTD